MERGDRDFKGVIKTFSPINIVNRVLFSAEAIVMILLQICIE